MNMKKTTLLNNGKIIDVISGLVYKANVLIEDGIITKIYSKKDSFTFQYSEDIITLDLEGKWLIPGLIDMHVHIKEGFAPLFVASGITTVRNTGGNVYELKRLREAPVEAPTPRVFSADRIIDGPPGQWGENSPWNINIDDPEEARKEVQRQLNAGADLIKVYGWLSEAIMTVVVEEAKKYGKEVSCDLVYSSKVNAIDAAKIGVKWNEHASGIIQSMYPNWSMDAENQYWNEVNWEEPDISLIKDICLQLIQFDVIICPTMTLFDQMDSFPNYWYPENKITKKMEENNSLIQQWKTISQFGNGLKSLSRQSKINKLIAKTYYHLGGTVVAGTDTPAGIWTLPGMALHRELELFVDAGFDEIDALRAATSIAAESLKNNNIGSIQEGSIADIIILSKNPIEDIRNTKEIDLIIKGGHIYNQNDLLKYVPNEEEVKKISEDFMNNFKVEM
ncbi:imidazolonepropionase [Bacillus sp. AFS002410]|uniref:amidohydrolase family protein n=1 Tax=Bacillus sp. AFS002410 TaxID=2033481 RepID=UPI000BF08471|nr:amidohydrolase family protein [Bacillus sp. AFS002410]PEJ59330.1 imidazolonepropionase [Bacillus sp. AFS002410]